MSYETHIWHVDEGNREVFSTNPPPSGKKGEWIKIRDIDYLITDRNSGTRPIFSTTETLTMNSSPVDVINITNIFVRAKSLAERERDNINVAVRLAEHEMITRGTPTQQLINQVSKVLWEYQNHSTADSQIILFVRKDLDLNTSEWRKRVANLIGATLCD